MSKLLPVLVLSSSLVSSFVVNATEFSVAGARYAAQGNTMTANANDSFALAVNPANLLSHGMGTHKELAINISSYPSMTENTENNNSVEIEQDSALQYIGGFYSSSSMVFGGYISSSSIPIEATLRNEEKLLNLDINQWGLALAWGSERENAEDTFDWGIGGSIDLFEAKNSDENEVAINSYEYTFSGKLRKQASFVFDHSSLDFITNLGVSYSSETSCDVEFYNECIIRPQITRLGLSTLIAHSSVSMSWDLTLTGEYVYQKSPEFSDDYTFLTIYDNEIRLGTEFMMMQPFGYDVDFAVRAGVVKKEDDDKSLFNSYGIGLSYTKYSYDLSFQESSRYAGEYEYNFSFIYQL